MLLPSIFEIIHIICDDVTAAGVFLCTNIRLIQLAKNPEKKLLAVPTNSSVVFW